MLPPRSVTNMRLGLDQRDTNAFHQMGQHDFGLAVPDGVQLGPVDGVAVRRVATVGPVQGAGGVVDFQVDGFGQVLEHDLDVAAAGRGFARGKLDSGTQDLAEPGVAGAFLGPVEVPAGMVDGDPDTPVRFVAAVLVTFAALHQGLDVGPVEIAAHDPHAFAVSPVQLAALGIEVKLVFRGV